MRASTQKLSPETVATPATAATMPAAVIGMKPGLADYKRAKWQATIMLCSLTFFTCLAVFALAGAVQAVLADLTVPGAILAILGVGFGFCGYKFYRDAAEAIIFYKINN